MKARVPGGRGPSDMNGILKQAQKMQEQMTEKQEELSEREYEGVSGGGVVKAVVKGSGEVLCLNISPEVVDPEDVEMLGDLVIAAINEAVKNAKDTEAEELSQISGGLNIPGLPGLF